MEKPRGIQPRILRWALGLLGIGVAAFVFWPQIRLLFQLLLGGWIIAFLLEPIAKRYENHMARTLATLCSFATVIGVLAGALLLLAAPLSAQFIDLIERLPVLITELQALLSRANEWLRQKNLFELSWPSLDFQAISGGLERVMGGTVGYATSMIDGVGRFGLMMMLGFFYLNDRDQMYFTIELLIPASARKLTLRMAANIKRELRVYVRGQMMIALIVGALSAIGFAIVGLPSYLVLGFLIGVFNMIPYFGPILGGIPALLVALGGGGWTFISTAAVLFTVQQLDGFIISPRVMSGLTGFTPATVLIAITLGGSAGGVLGMLFAIPCLLIGKICYRIWVMRNEAATVERVAWSFAEDKNAAAPERE